VFIVIHPGLQAQPSVTNFLNVTAELIGEGEGEGA
jgi:hypothetical protein